MSIPCPASAWNCPYHACMSDDCQKVFCEDMIPYYGEGVCMGNEAIKQPKEEQEMKYYFEDIDSEQCFTKDTFIDMMKFNNVKEMEVLEAIKETVSGMIYCKASGSVGEKGECGKQCDDYQPKNGKSGMCRNQGQLYRHGDKVILKLNKKE